MSIKTDFHLHSHFSDDCTTSMEDMIQTGIKKGFTSMCFTEHHDPNFPTRHGELETQFNLDLVAYYKELSQLKDKYCSQIKVLFGVELGLQAKLAKEHLFFTKGYDFDFIIGSSHLCNGGNPYFPEFFHGKIESNVYSEYFNSIIEIIKVFKDFDVYGHLDYIVRYGPTKNTHYSYKKYADIIDTILLLIIENNKGIEINTGGFKYGLGDANPCTDIIKRYRELGGEIITIGSDAHFTEYIGYEFDKASTILKSCGFQYYTVFEKRKASFLPLN